MRLNIRDVTREVGPTELIEIIEKWKDVFPDLHYEILHVVAEENLVAINSILKGTPVKPYKSYQPRGKSIAVPHAFFFRFEAQKIVEVGKSMILP